MSVPVKAGAVIRGTGGVLHSKTLRRHELWPYPDGPLLASWWNDCRDDPVYAAGERERLHVLDNRLATPPILETPYGCAGGWQALGAVDGIEIETRFELQGFDNIGAQFGGAVHQRPTAAGTDPLLDVLGATFIPDITIGASVGALGCYLHGISNEPFTVPEGMFDMNFCLPGRHDFSHTKIVCAGDKIAGFMFTDTGGWERCAGPVDLATFAAELVGVDGWGFYLVNGFGDPNMKDGQQVTIRDYHGPALGSHPATPTIAALGAAVKGAAVSAIDVALPACQAGDLIMVALWCSATTAQPPAPAGWSVLAQSGGTTANRLVIYKRDTRATGAEGGTVTFATLAGTANLGARSFALRGANPWADPLGMSGTFKSSTADTTLPAPDQQLSGLNQLALWIGGCQANETISAPAGFTDHGQLGTAGAALNLAICSKPISLTTRGRIPVTGLVGARATNGNGTAISATAFADPR